MEKFYSIGDHRILLRNDEMKEKKMLLIPFMLLIYAAEWILIKTKKKIKNTCGSLRKISQSRFKLRRINKTRVKYYFVFKIFLFPYV